MTDYRTYRKVDGYEVHPTDINRKAVNNGGFSHEDN